MGLAATLYHQGEKKPYIMAHFLLKLNGKPKWSILFKDLKNPIKNMKNIKGTNS